MTSDINDPTEAAVTKIVASFPTAAVVMYASGSFAIPVRSIGYDNVGNSVKLFHEDAIFQDDRYTYGVFTPLYDLVKDQFVPEFKADVVLFSRRI